MFCENEKKIEGVPMQWCDNCQYGSDILYLNKIVCYLHDDLVSPCDKCGLWSDRA